jgi:hypothetical protein
LALCVVAMCACARQTVLLDAPPQTDPPVRSIAVPGLFFEYPGSWSTFANQLQSPGPEVPGQPGPTPTTSQPEPTPGRPDPTEAPGIQNLYVSAVGLDGLNLVEVRIRSVPVPEGEPNSWRAVRQDWEGSLSGTRVLARGDVTVAGLTGAFWRFRAQSGAGYVTTSTLVVVLQGIREYSILCEAIPERATEIARGCQQVLSTLQLG